jgi:hypothetical protein
MKDVVPRIEVSHVAQAFLAALVVNADSEEVRRSQVLPQPKIRAAQHGELFERIADIDLTIAKAIRPEILVVADDCWTIVREDHPQSDAPDEL